MPVRLLTSSTLNWPKQDEVHQAAVVFAEQLKADPQIEAVAYFGSYARGDWGVGSDLDLLVIARTPAPSAERHYATHDLPVPCDLIIYTPLEWLELQKQRSHWIETLKRELVWLVRKNSSL